MRCLRNVLFFLLLACFPGLAAAQRLSLSPPPFPAALPNAVYQFADAFPGVKFSFATDRIVGMSTPPGRTNELYVVGQLGRILVITNLASPTRTVFLDLSADTYSDGESGMVGLAFHPQYAVNRQFFVFYTRTNRTLGKTYDTVSRFLRDPVNPWVAVRSSETFLISQPDRDYIHQGGDIQFGPDGYLYVPLGDEGSQNDPFNNSQRIDKDFFSAVLRLDVDGRPGSLAPNPHPSVGTGYWVPPDNPFIGATSFNGKPVSPSSVRTEFWTVGTRNPHRMTFDSLTGDLYDGDVGGTRREEVNRVTRGANLGWVYYEGTLLNTNSPYGPPPPGVVFTPPIYEYGRSDGDPNFQGQAVIGGLVYRGTKYPDLYGKYLFGDYISRHVWALDLAATNGTGVIRLGTADYGFTGFGINPATGDILLAERNGERIIKLVRGVAALDSVLPPTLSATRIFSSVPNVVPVAGVRPYEVASPFWSDYAIKRRWFFIQDPVATIQRDSSDQWTFPTGTVWMKHFDLEMVRGDPTTRRRVETRFIIKTANAVYGLSYRWRADGSDADLVPDAGVDSTFAVQEGGVSHNQVWHFPSRSECLVCHTATAGFALGFSTRQLNVNIVENGVTTNQIARLSGLGLIQPPIPNPSIFPRLVAINDTSATLEHRFKSYVDANCSYCHQPTGAGRGAWDSRYDIPLDQMNVINGPVIDDLGAVDGRIIRPGDTNASVLWRRIAAMGSNHMPPLATAELNVAAIDLVRQYIESVQPLPISEVWQIGNDAPPGAPTATTFAEFSIQNNIADAPPGKVTRKPTDWLYAAATNPGADDDYYLPGVYPPGFNGLTDTLYIPLGEPFVAWEHSHTIGDPANRIHFPLNNEQIGSNARLKLTLEYSSGGSTISGILQPGFSQHDLVVRFRNGNGNTTQIYSGRVTQITNVVIDFGATNVAATLGPNTIEVVRTGPVVAGTSYWLAYDQVRLEAYPASNTPPVLTTVLDRTVDEGAALSLQLSGVDQETPANQLIFGLVSGPPGMMVSPTGVLTWNPSETQGPATYSVVVRVTDLGSPAQSDTGQFNVVVREVNQAPIMAAVANARVEKGVPLSIQLGVTDNDKPANSLNYDLPVAPNGMTVSATGLITWIPGSDQGPSTNVVVARATDTGNPPLAVSRQFEVVVVEAGLPPLTLRTMWQVGTEALPTDSLVSTYSEFSAQNNINDLPPGRVTRLPGDPQYVAAANPGADDDFYFLGNYRAGFNSLVTDLVVPNDEPAKAWEMNHTIGDRTNRIHFPLASSQVGGTSGFRLTAKFPVGGSVVGGVIQPGFALHNFVIRFRNGAGVSTLLFSNQISMATNIVLEFSAASVQATAGPNTVELVREGPVSNVASYWLTYDFLRLEALAGANSAPVFSGTPPLTAVKGTLYVAQLEASDLETPSNALAFQILSAPAGVSMDTHGLINWVPDTGLASGPYLVKVRVSDTGNPPLSATNVMTISVQDPVTFRNVWQIGSDAPPGSSVLTTFQEFSLQNNRNDPPPGVVTRVSGDPQYNPLANPGADDDFYFLGNYPTGFNSLISPLAVPNDEPPSAWEYNLTLGDRTNRFHFPLASQQVKAGSGLRLTVEFSYGGSSVDGVAQPGFANHDVVVRFRNGAGVVTQLYSSRLSQPSTIVLNFLASQVAASVGPNSIELVRTGPAALGVSYWLTFDFVKLEAIPATVSSTSEGPLGFTSGGLQAAGSADLVLRFDDRLSLAGLVGEGGELYHGSAFLEGSEYLTVTFTRPEPAPNGIAYVVEASEDLVHWSSDGIELIATSVSGGWRSLTYRDGAPVGGPGPRFMRLRLAVTQVSNSSSGVSPASK